VLHLPAWIGKAEVYKLDVIIGELLDDVTGSRHDELSLVLIIPDQSAFNRTIKGRKVDRF
jgi:hypothetical protein